MRINKSWPWLCPSQRCRQKYKTTLLKVLQKQNFAKVSKLDPKSCRDQFLDSQLIRFVRDKISSKREEGVREREKEGEREGQNLNLACFVKKNRTLNKTDICAENLAGCCCRRRCCHQRRCSRCRRGCCCCCY